MRLKGKELYLKQKSTTNKQGNNKGINLLNYKSKILNHIAQ